MTESRLAVGEWEESGGAVEAAAAEQAEEREEEETSAAQTAATTAGSNHEATASDFHSKQRNHHVKQQHLQRRRRWLMFGYCFAVVSLAAGVVYGWPALRQELQDEDDANPGSDGKWSSETALGAAFTAGAWSTQGSRFFTGMARDRWGARVAAATCLFIVALGSVGVAYSTSPATMAAALLAQGIGSGAQLCVQPVAAQLFPQNAGAALATLSGAFQISGLVYLTIAAIFKERRAGFLTYAGLVVGFAIVAFWVLPRKPAPAAGADEQACCSAGKEPAAEQQRQEVKETTAIVETTTPPVSTTHSSVVVHEKSVVAEKETDPELDLEGISDNDDDNGKSTHGGDASVTTAWQHITSWKYLLMVQWFSLCITPLQYYVGSIGFQLEELGDDDGKYAQLFTILYGCAAILSPAGGALADRFTLGLAHGVATALSAMSFFWLAASDAERGFLPLEWQPVGLTCNALGRMWVFGTFFAHVGRVFGYQHFGTLAGLALFLSAIVSLLQYPLLAGAAHGHAAAMNLLCGGILTAQLGYCYWLHRRHAAGKM